MKLLGFYIDVSFLNAKRKKWDKSIISLTINYFMFNYLKNTTFKLMAIKS